MLVLELQKDERVIIGDQTVVITLVEIRSDKIRLGFTADRSVEIDRESVRARKDAGRWAKE